MKSSLLTIVVIFTLGCQTAQTVTIAAKHDATLTTAEGDESKLAANTPESFPLHSPTYLESPGKVGLLLVPVDQYTDTVNVTLRPVSSWGGEVADKKANQIVNSVIREVFKANIDLAKGSPETALASIESIHLKHPDITFLNFIKASCLTLLNRKDDALKSLKRALKDFPNNESGRTLYLELAGKEYVE